ncbi:hypothetical protein CTB25_23130 [Salmonella enterica subsp. enterica serovar Muenster]|nr:hypothetical protein [Salmonella enterica subsp. enterica serovar Muenster]
MPFAILRAEKLKTPGNIAGSLAHTFRTRDTPNADASRTPANEVLAGGAAPDEVKQAIAKRLPEKRRSDAVLAVEYFIGASPEAFSGGQDGSAYFRDALDWLKARHGAENVVSAVIHRDETSPHMTAMVVPLDEAGKLNAKKFLGGRATLSAMQTDFAEKVGRRHGLERGLEGSKATHKTIREFYGELQQVSRENGSQAVVEASMRIGEAVRTINPKELKPQVVETKMFGLARVSESDAEIETRLAKKLAPAVAPVVQKQAQEIARLRAEKRQWDAERRRMTKENRTIKDLFGELFEHSKRLKPERFKEITGRVLDAIRAEVKQIRAARAMERPGKSRGGGIER